MTGTPLRLLRARTLEASARRLRIIACAVLVALSVPAATDFALAAPHVPGMKYCGSFNAKSLRIYVYANGHVTCAKSRRVQKAYWRGKTVYHDCSPACAYSTLKRYPGWRCNSGAGGGDCRKRKKVSHYESRVR